MIKALVDRWKRRNWRLDQKALSQLGDTAPAIVVTGGSDGIGLALAAAFAKRAGSLVLVARDAERLAVAQQEFSVDRPDGDEVLVLALDVTDGDATEKLIAFLDAHGLHADVLINAAGIGNSGDFVEEDPNRLEQLCELNVTALTRLIRAFLPDMLVRGRGGIINMASLGGFAPGPYQSAYYASKAYVISLNRALAHETRGMGVRLVCVAPGPVNTAFHARAGAESAFYRYILPAMSPEAVAGSVRRGYDFGHGLVVPGIFATILGLVMRVTPAVLSTPIIAILLKPRG